MTPTQLVWVQNLIGFINGQFPADERWKAIFIEQLSALPGTTHKMRTETAQKQPAPIEMNENKAGA